MGYIGRKLENHDEVARHIADDYSGRVTHLYRPKLNSVIGE
jgi:hypothetical protein